MNDYFIARRQFQKKLERNYSECELTDEIINDLKNNPALITELLNYFGISDKQCIIIDKYVCPGCGNNNT